LYKLNGPVSSFLDGLQYFQVTKTEMRKITLPAADIIIIIVRPLSSAVTGNVSFPVVERVVEEVEIVEVKEVEIVEVKVVEIVEVKEVEKVVGNVNDRTNFGISAKSEKDPIPSWPRSFSPQQKNETSKICGASV